MSGEKEKVLTGSDFDTVKMNGCSLLDVVGVRVNVPATGFCEVTLKLMVTDFKCVDRQISFDTRCEL